MGLDPSAISLSLSRDARLIAGITLLTVPTIQYGGYFLLRSLTDRQSSYMENALRQNFFRAGHAHAGVLVILSLVCQVLVDATALLTPWGWVARLGVPAAAILIPAGFFVALPAPKSTTPNGAVKLIYVGAGALAASVLTLGVGLLRTL
jgi:Ni,Fe-hydrogenase I cytochrome b subunit